VANRLTGLTVAFLIANEGTEKVELTQPWEAVTQEGGRPMLLAPRAGEAILFNHLDRADSWPVDQTVDQAQSGDFGALVLPGGVANADFLRMSAPAVQFVRDFVTSGRPVAVICHAPWTLVEAGVLSGRTITSYPSLRTDIVNAGGNWVDREVVVDDRGPNVLISSRRPADLPAFCEALVEQFSRQLAGTR
jgi:protease I